MTTDRDDEARARIEGEIAECEKFLDLVDDVWISQEQIDICNCQLSAWTTLKVVLELHGPFTTRSGLLVCAECSNDPYEDSFVSFPCPTAEKIIEGVLE